MNGWSTTGKKPKSHAGHTLPLRTRPSHHEPLLSEASIEPSTARTYVSLSPTSCLAPNHIRRDLHPYNSSDDEEENDVISPLPTSFPAPLHSLYPKHEPTQDAWNHSNPSPHRQTKPNNEPYQREGTNNSWHAPEPVSTGSFLSRLRPTIILFQIFGLYSKPQPRPSDLDSPFDVDEEEDIAHLSSRRPSEPGGFQAADGAACFESQVKVGTRRRKFRGRVSITRSILRALVTVTFFGLTCVYCTVNICIIGLVVWVIQEYLSVFGLWHPETVASIITGMKPCQSLINLLIFLLMRGPHERLLAYLDSVNAAFLSDFGLTPDVRRINATLLGASGTLFGFTFLLRTIEYLLTVYFSPGYMEEIAHSWLFEYLPFILLPMFTVWQTLPLLYFMTLTSLVRFWLTALISSLQRDPKFHRYPMSLYFDHFCSLTLAMRKICGVFSLFLLFSLGLCVLTLCLTVYFVTQTKNIVPESSDVIFYFNFVWSSAQITVLFTYLVSICISGFKTNEKARKVLQAALSTKPDNQDDRFQIFCLSEKIHLQYGWGISVWRGFLIERSLLFTIVGLIITYALVLLRMKPHDSCLNQPRPVENNTEYGNTLSLDLSDSILLFNTTSPSIISAHTSTVSSFVVGAAAHFAKNVTQSVVGSIRSINVSNISAALQPILIQNLNSSLGGPQGMG